MNDTVYYGIPDYYSAKYRTYFMAHTDRLNILDFLLHQSFQSKKPLLFASKKLPIHKGKAVLIGY